MKKLLPVFLFTAAIALAAESGPQPGGGGTAFDIWKWVNFVLLAVGLGYLIAKYMPAFFQSRTASIQRGIVEAQQMKHDAERRAAEVDARMNALGAEIEKFRAQAHREMEQEGDRIRRETADQIEKLERRAELEIESAGKAAARDLRTHAADLALRLAEQRIRTRLDSGTEAALVDNFVRDLTREEARN